MIKVIEVRVNDHIKDIENLALINRNECAPHIPFDPYAIWHTAQTVFKDDERKNINAWMAYQDGEPIGYAVAYCSSFFFNFENIAKLELLYVIPAKRGTWAAIRLVKAFEEWGRLNGSLQLYVGVARTDKDEAKKIRKLFPRMGYEWCGSYYLKETV